MNPHKTKLILQKAYDKLFQKFGRQYWWPAETRFEVVVGAILTQNTNWGNVEKAIHNLKANHCLSARVLKDIPIDKLAALIKPAGYFNIQARRLKNFISFLFNKYGGSLDRMAKKDWQGLRQELLSVNGIGPETADSILLYALDKPVFVVDAYTKRFLLRHHLIDERADYHQVQKLFMDCLEHDVGKFNEYHALIVSLGKNYCKSKPLCEHCPLNFFFDTSVNERYKISYRNKKESFKRKEMI